MSTRAETGLLVFVALAALAAIASAGADYACRRLHVPSLLATSLVVVCFGVSGAAAARLSLARGEDLRRARVAVLFGAALFAALSSALLVGLAGTRGAAAAVAGLLDFGFAALAGLLGVAREARRAGHGAPHAKR